MQAGGPDIVLIFEVHQPYRLAQHPLARKALEGRASFEDLKNAYFDEALTRRIFERVSSRCYKPATSMFLRLLDEHEGFRVSYSISGVLLEQAERWDPDLLELFKQAAKHKRCEMLCQTYYHSLAYFISREEFIEQVEMHRRTVKDLLGAEPRVFENTELIYDNNVARIAWELGFRAVVTEGVERVLGWRSPNYVYRARSVDVKLLLRNYRLSDDIGFRFASVRWEEYPLTSEKYATWLAATPGQLICIFIDYETVGEHYPKETGIFEFFQWLPVEAERRGLRFATPSEAIERHTPVDEIDVSGTISWADVERDTSAWLGNVMQQLSFIREARLEPLVKALGDPAALRLWRLLSISDHYYYMSTKGGGPGEVHSYFSPYQSPYHAFSAFTEAIADFEAELFRRVAGREGAARWLRPLPEVEAFRFYMHEGEPLPYAARSGLDLMEAVRRVPERSLEFHVERGHLTAWLRLVIGDDVAAEVDKLRDLKGEKLRSELYKMLRRKLEEAVSAAR